ncbi:MAG: flagellar hook-basal body complex protein FliE [Phycisphaerae bacterium]|nr:MAG: flagellar hook-basal body complex protein FliE [Phycisphaerae bacterium]
MIDPTGITDVSKVAVPASPTSQLVVPAGEKGFYEVMLNSLDEVNRLQTEADQGVQDLYSGKTDDVASVFTAVNKAGVAFDLLMEMRNKLMDAYRDIQQIRV